MKVADLLGGQAVFIDANVFVYHFRPDPLLGTLCDQLLRRIENQEVQGFTSAHALNEMAHRLMTDEASQLFGCDTRSQVEL
jgi:predicted nucleic acid-binding protein